MTRYRCGLIVGKFAPLHLGHEELLQVARAQCDRLFVLSYTKPEFRGCEPSRRRAWLAARAPGIEALVLDDDAWRAAGHAAGLPHNDAPVAEQRELVARVCRELLGVMPDAVFTGEAYGDGFAAHLARSFGRPVQHVLIDRGLKAEPVSATAIRRDVDAGRRWLAPEVYASFVRRVAIVGGESSGKSTLAIDLARALGTVSVPEYGRELWEARGGQLSFDDMLEIAAVQVEREEVALCEARGYVVCDTTPLTTLLYSEDMFGRSDPRLTSLSTRSYDLTILAAPDFPFVQDGTRRDAAYRAGQHARYEACLIAREAPWLLAQGSPQQRVARVLQRLELERPSQTTLAALSA